MSETRALKPQRRVFMLSLAGGGLVLGAGAHLQARAQPKMLDEKDPQAVALGYVAEASKTDVKKFPKYVAGQNCTNCSLYQGKASDPAAACPLFAGKLVAGKGWCNAWAKKG